jgi:hypothetical protein
LKTHAGPQAHAVLPGRWAGYPPHQGRSLTCYAPVRRSLIAQRPRLACVKHAASVRPEPGSNSPIEKFDVALSFAIIAFAMMRPNHYRMFGLTLPLAPNEQRINESASHIHRSQLSCQTASCILPDRFPRSALQSSALSTLTRHHSVPRKCAAISTIPRTTDNLRFRRQFCSSLST